MSLCARSIQLGLLTIAALSLAASVASAAPCIIADSGIGTIEMPPSGCEYVGDASAGHNDKYVILDGLPPGTTIEMVPVHQDFLCFDQLGQCSFQMPPDECESVGGALGGNGHCASSAVVLQIEGTSFLAGFQRTLYVPLFWEAHSGPRNPGDPLQSFPTHMMNLEGEIFGDPDFCTFSFRAGLGWGLPGPGHTTLTRLGPPGSDFEVESFFDITYEIDFQGCPGSMLDGLAGSTFGTIRIRAGDPPPIVSPVPAFAPLGIAVLLAVFSATACWRLRGPSSGS